MENMTQEEYRKFIMTFYKYTESDPVKSDFHIEYGSDATKFSNARQCAIQSVTHTINAMGMIQDDISDKVFIYWKDLKKRLEEV